MSGTIKKYEFGTFMPDNHLLGEEWEPPKPDGVWSIGKKASLCLKLPPSPQHLLLEFRLEPQVTDNSARTNTARLHIDDTIIAKRRLGHDCLWRIEFDQKTTQEREIKITIELTEADKGADRLRLRHLVLMENPLLPQPAHEVVDLQIGWNHATESLLGAGFGPPQDRFAWMFGPLSILRLPVKRNSPKLTILLKLSPFLRPPHQTRQRVIIGADDRLAGVFSISERCTIAINAQPDPSRDEILLSFNNPDANFESDDPIYHLDKPFACALFGVRITAALPTAPAATLPALTGTLSDGSLQREITALTFLPGKEISADFESIGASCLLPYTQRKLGDERIGLLPFTMSLQPGLVDAILDGFALVGRADCYEWGIRHQTDPGWRLVETSYDLNFATGYPLTSPAPKDGFHRMSRVLSHLRDRLMTELCGNEKIFVYRTAPHLHEQTAEAMALAIWASLRKWSNARLLWLTDATSLPPGCAQRLPSGLVRGHLTAAGANEQAHFDSMASVLANAWRLFSQHD